MPDTSYDLIVVGSGVGGLTAVIAAKRAGLRAVLIEKTALIGGSSSLSGGVLWLPDNPLMRRDGIADSREAGLAYLANFVPGDPAWSSHARRAAYVDTVAPLVALYTEEGVPLLRCDGYSDYYDDLPGGNATGRSLETPIFDANRLGDWKARLRPPSVPIPIRTSEAAAMLTLGFTMKGKKTAARIAARVIGAKLTGKTLYSAGGAMQGRLLEVALRLGCEIRTETAFTGFDMRDGRVEGVHVEHGDGTDTLRATRGVLITAGGFSHNHRMRQTHQRAPISNEWTSSNPGDTGEAIEAMIAAGADTAMMEEAWWAMTFVPPDGPKEIIVSELSKPHGLLVDRTGKRFVDEATSYMEVGRACFEHGAVPAWLVLDAQARKRYFFSQRPPGRMPKKLIEQGVVKQDTTLAGLARQCGIDPAGLEATVARFNGFAATGVDEDFRRGANAYDRYYADPTHLPNPSLGAVEKAPFWAIPLYPGDVGTCGGVVTDEHARVLRGDGSVIAGLYAAGNCTAPLAGPHYIGAGQSIATAAIFGYRAVQHGRG